MKKSGFFRGVFDGIRSTVGQPSSSSSSLSGAKAFLESETEEVLKPSHFKINTIVQHGFPYQPTSIAFDPIQRLIAIGSKNGSLRILGRPGVDISLRHVTEFAVLQIIFIINEGQLITVCADDSIHLWNLRNKSPEIVHSLKFQKERISYCYLPFQSKWMYIGTERGNVYVVNIDTFAMSGHVINWNKAIEISRKTHPGSIIHLSDCPIDSNKLLIGYDSGIIVLWDLRNKSADFRHSYPEGILSISWHSEGRQFICSHADGSLSTWNLKAGSRPQSSIYPLAKSGDPKSELYSKIPKVEWRTSRTGDAYIMFSGGLVVGNGGEGANSKRVLTVIHGKSPTMLEMEHDIIDFITLCESPYEADFNDPYAIVVLLSNDLVVVNLQQPGYPCYTNPYPMDLHESPVTYCYYLANCPPDLIHAFYTVGQKSNKRSGMLERDWPINGGEWGSSTVSYPEIIITGHADGSLKFWDASAVNLQILYKLKTAKLFEKPRLINISQSFNNQNNNNNNNNNNGNNNNNNNNNSNNNNTTNNNGTSEMEDLFAIEFLTFSAENRVLCIAGASSQVIVFRFSKQEAQSEITVIEVPMNYDEIDSQSDSEILSGASALLHKADTHDPSAYYPLKVRTGHHKRLSGFQAEIVCLSPWIDRKTPPYRITSMSYNMHANLFAYGTENSLVIIDLVQKSIVLNVSTASLYGTSDPYQRTRPKRCTSAGPHSKDSNDHNNDVDRCRSPITTDNDVCMSPTTINVNRNSGFHHHSSLSSTSTNFEGSTGGGTGGGGGSGGCSPSALGTATSTALSSSSSPSATSSSPAAATSAVVSTASSSNVSRSKAIPQSVVNTELKRSRSQDSNNLLNPNQFGFRAGKSTKDALLKIINDIEQQKNKFKAIIVVDFKGAFDNASHRLIMNSLDNLNCPTYICSIISHYLNNRKIIVKTNHTMCNHHPTGRGCPQGGVLSPLLWNIALDNLLNILSESNINTTAYADDLTLVISATDRQKLIDLINNTVQIIFDWAQNNNIPVNKDKTNVMFISKRKTIPPTTTIINSVESTKILGIIFSHNLRFDEHVHKKISDAYKYMNILKNYVSAKFGLSSKKRITLYNCFVKPSLLYAAELWFNKINNRSKRMLTTLDNAMLRNTINAYRSTPINCINILTNTIPIIEIIKCKQKINNLYPKKHHRSIINYLNNRIIPTKNKPKNTRIIIDINYKHEKQFIYCVANFTSNNDTTTNCLHTKYYSHTGIEEAIINTTKKSIKKLTVLNNLQPNTSIFLRCPKKTYLTTSETFVSTNTIKLYQLLNQYSLTLCINYKTTSEFPNIFSDNIKTSHNFYDKKSFSILIKNESNQILNVIKQNCTKPLVIILNENKNFQLLSINQAITSLTTGHGPTRDHLFKKFNIGSTSRCSSCEADQNYNHLLSCPIFTDILDSYNTVNIDNIENLMVNLLRENKFEQFAMDIHKKLINLNSSII